MNSNWGYIIGIGIAISLCLPAIIWLGIPLSFVRAYEINNLECTVLKQRIDDLYYHNYLLDAVTEYQNRCVQNK